MPVPVVCLWCAAPFSVKPSMIESGRGRYCSVPCKRKGAKAPRFTKTCTVCHTDFERIKHRAEETTGLYCSKLCFETQRRARVTCDVCGKVFSVPRYRVVRRNLRHCSPDCGRVTMVQVQANDGGSAAIRQKIASGYRTDIEALVEAVLNRKGIVYQFEQQMGRWFVDFLLPDLGVALECDGRWHDRDDQRAKDALKDAYLTAAGWRVVRLSHTDIYSDAESAVQRGLRT